MLTKNWYRVTSMMVFATSTNSGDGAICKNMKGTTTQISPGSFLNLFGYYSGTLKTAIATGSSANGVFFGTGDATPTVDDYTLAGDVISGISITASKNSVGKELDAGYAELTTVYGISNNNTEEVTVREIALAYYGCILDRTVLDTPVTIPAGGIGQVTYTIRMNYPTV